MYLAVDIGGTKTLLATFKKGGQLVETFKFPTNQDYDKFLDDLKVALKQLKADDFLAACVAAPGKVDRKHGVALDFGNLPWENVPIERNLERMLHCPVLVENDANLAGLSEAHQVPKYKRVLYVTISTGIGTGIIVDGVIEPDFADSEGGQMMLSHDNRFVKWESFASGKAIVRRYGKRASDITDDATWRKISHDIAVGLLNLIAIVQPEIIVFGGGVGNHFDRFKDFLKTELNKYDTPLTPTPILREAKHAEEAVIYGCYDLLKATYGHIHS